MITYVQDILWNDNGCIHIHAKMFVRLKTSLPCGDEMLIALLQKAIDDCDSKSTYSLRIDMERISVTTVEKHLSTIRSISAYFQNYETNAEATSCVLYNTPYTFHTIWNMIKPFIKTETKKIITVEKRPSACEKVETQSCALTNY